MYQKFMFVFIVVMVGVSVAQHVPEDSLERMLERAKGYYNSGEYEDAISELENALQFLKQLEQSDQVEAFKYLAFSYVAFGDKDKAKEMFKKVLQLDPTLELDPATVSPKIIMVFEETKAEMPVETIEPPVVEPTKPGQKEPVKGYGMALPFCCIPGWAQMNRGEGGKGTKLMIAGGVTFGVSLISVIAREASYNKYIEVGPGEEDEMEDAYQKYRFWHNASAISVTLFLGVYVYNLFDVVLAKPKTASSMIDSNHGLYCNVSGDQINICYKINF